MDGKCLKPANFSSAENVQKEEEITKRLNEFDATLVDDNHEDSVEGFMVHGRKVLETREFFKCGAAMVPTSIGRYRLQNIADKFPTQVIPFHDHRLTGTI